MKKWQIAGISAVVLASGITLAMFSHHHAPKAKPVVVPVTANKISGPVTGQLQDHIDLWLSSDSTDVTNVDVVSASFCAATANVLGQKTSTCSEPDRKLQLGGKRQLTGITMTPDVHGEWRWDNDYKLVFSPAQPWVPGQDYKVAFDPSIFPSQVTLHGNGVLKESDFAIHSQPLHASIDTMEFFQDPNEPEKRGVSASLSFNNPVDSIELKKHLIARMAEVVETIKEEGNKTVKEKKFAFSGQPFQFDVKVSEDALSANISIPIATMPDKERFLVLDIEGGLTARTGGTSLPELDPKKPAAGREQQVRIPSIYDYAEFESVDARIIQADHYIPEQTLIIQGNVPVTGDDLSRYLHIYILPKDKASEIEGKKARIDYQWKSSNEVTDDILQKSPEIKFTMDTKDAALMHGIKIDAIPDRWLLVRIGKGLPFKGGYILSKEHTDTIEAPEYTKEVKILSDGALLSLGGEKKISLYTLGADKVSFDVGRVINDDINHLVSQTNGTFKNPNFNTSGFDQNNITESFSEDLDLSAADMHKPQFNAFSFDRYVKARSGVKGNLAAKGKGLFFLDINAYAKDDHGVEQVVGTDHRFILVSDLGLVVKTSANGSHDVFVQSISHGSGVSGVHVEVLGVNGVPVASVTTDSEGHAVIPALDGLDNESKPVAYVAHYGDDMSFMPYARRDRGLDYSKFDTDGMSGYGDALHAYLFSDRGVYRPGEQAHIGMIVKQGDWSKDLTGLPLRLELTNPRGQVIDNPLIKLQASGMAEYSFSTHDTSPTGIYNVRLYITHDGNEKDELGSAAVRVEEFIPDTLKISSKFNKPLPKGWLTPDALGADVTLSHLYGTAAVNHRVKASLSVNPGFFAFKEYPGYNFFDALKSEKSFDQPIGEIQTDAKGHALFDLELAQFGKSTYRLNFEAEGFAQDSGRSVFTKNTVLVSALPYVVGMKTDGNLGYINKNEKRTINFIAIDPALAHVAVKGLTAEISKIDYISTLIKNEQGAYEYRSVQRKTHISAENIDIPAKGFNYTVDSTKPGSYEIVLSNSDGLVMHQIGFSIVGEGNMIDHARKDAAITVLLDKEKYAEQDTIKMNITSPYTGAGLVTLETDKVVAFKWFKATTTSSVQTISVPKGFTGKGFVNVQFLRALDSKEVYTDPFAYTVKPFFVDTASIDSQIKLSAPERTKPGDDLAIKYSVKTPGKIILYGVDEGILQYAHYTTPNPLDFFVNRRALEVATAQILDLLMPEYSLLRSATGGSNAIPDGKNVNPFKRKTQAPVAFWSGVIDATGEPQVFHYKVPDYFNGNLRVMAVAVSDKTIGAADAAAYVKGDVIISPNVPTFAAPGDVFTVGLSIANNIKDSGANASVKLTVTPSEHLEVVAGQETAVTVPEGGEAKADITVKAKDVLGGAKLTFTAILNGVTTTYEATLSVRPPLPSMTALVSGYVEKGDKAVQQDRDLYREFASVDAAVSTLPISLIPGLSQYLDRFPYGCTEQTVSKAFPAVTLYGQKDLGGTTPVVVDSVVNTMMRLRELQNSKGGFGYWWYGGQANDFVSVYALHYMTVAREKHLPVPDETFRKAQDYVRGMVSGNPGSMDDARVQAYGIYVLTRGGVLTSNYLPHLLQYLNNNDEGAWKQDLAAVYIAASYKLMQLTPEANDLMNEFTVGDPVYWKAHGSYQNETAFYNSLDRYSQYLTVVSDNFPEMLPKLDRNILYRIANFIGEGNYNTLSSSYAIMAFNAYGQASTSDVGEKLTINDNGKQMPLTGALVKRAQLALEKGNVTFGGGGDYGIFYQIATDGYDHESATQPIEDGLEISREFLDKDGKAVKDVALGDTVNVVIHMRAHDDKTLENMAVVDLLPGGFEVVPQSISRPSAGAAHNSGDTDNDADDNNAQTESGSWQPEAVDAREDRVIAFGAIPANEVTYHYSMKAINAGTFTVPPAYTESMYERTIKARGITGSIVVK